MRLLAATPCAARCLLFAPMLLIVASCSSEERGVDRHVHWGYEGIEGPAEWGNLSPEYALCSSGASQSPVDIDHTEVDGETPLAFDYGTSELNIAFHQHVENVVDNGHTIQINVDEGSKLSVGGKAYQLKQFHFHTPSEHTIDGRQYPVEMHFVHQGESGDFVVVGVLVEEGNESPSFAKVSPHLPRVKGESKDLAGLTLDLHLHVPQGEGAYVYTGSLTTPPCSEGVQWFVLRAHPTMSAAQIEVLTSIIGPNNRPVQPLNARRVRSMSLGGLPSDSGL